MSRLDYSTYLALPALRSEAYQELEGSGRLSLLRATELRSAIAGIVNDYESARPFFLNPIGVYRRLLSETQPRRAFNDYRVGSGVPDAAVVVAAVEAFRSDPRFSAAANAEVFYAADLLFHIRNLIPRIEEILSRLVAGGSMGTVREVPRPLIERPRSQGPGNGSQ